MKLFCMGCGKPSEYFGEQNKPSSCKYCKTSFAAKSFSPKKAVASASQDDDDEEEDDDYDDGSVKKSSGGFEVQGKFLDINFLRDLITVEVQDD